MKILKYIIPVLALTMTTNNINAEEVKGVDRANLDETVSPGEDFYEYACGGWMKNNPLPAQYSRFGTFDQLAENPSGLFICRLGILHFCLRLLSWYLACKVVAFSILAEGKVLLRQP